jgi:hypothetical protein
MDMVSISGIAQLSIASLGHIARFAVAFAICLYLRDMIGILYVCLGPAASYHSLREFGACAFCTLVFADSLPFTDSQAALFGLGARHEDLGSVLGYYAPVGIVALAIAIAWGRRRHRV